MPTTTSKHVRFASTNTLYSLTSPPSTIPWKESYTKARRSSFSSVPSSTASSSYGGSPPKPIPPIQQQQFLQQPVEYTRSRRSSSSSSKGSSSQGTPLKTPQTLPRMPTPDFSSIKMHLHFLLAYSPFVKTVVKYDLTIHPSVLADHYHSSSLMEPATNPPVPSLTITSPHLQWPIFVKPNKYFATQYVTVVDVLNCLYHDLRLTVHKSEYEALNQKDKRNVDAAYFARCGQLVDPDARRDEHLKGVKRVDFLMGRNRFLGLSGTRKHPNIWELNVSPWAGD